jgi:hypothetical protein
MEAPRWRLINAHYLKIKTFPDGTPCEWEYKEADRTTGRQARKLFAVPALLNPLDQADCNYPGELIVAHAVEGVRNLRPDYIFEGDPTPEMEPLNEEAEAISDSMKHKWAHPIDSLPANGGMSPQEQLFMQNMMTEFAKQIGASMPAANTSVPSDEVTELKERLARLEALLAAGGAAKSIETPTLRR